MKHTFKVTLLLIVIFLISQVFGLFTLNKDLKVIKDETSGKIIGINYSDTAIGERPHMSNSQVFVYIISAVFIGTLILLGLIKFNMVKIWKTWFFLAVFLTITVTLGVFISTAFAYYFAFLIALWKLFFPNFIVHNLSEVLMYTGIAVLFVPLLNVFWVLMLLLVISLYDVYAVWKSKHMITLANFQTKTKLFAGLSIPYAKKEKINKSRINFKIEKSENFKSDEGGKIAILGGGDIAFPLIFSGVVMQSLVIEKGIEKLQALFYIQIVTLFITTALFLLLFYAKKDKFYPAMPFITSGCLIGYWVLMIVL